MASEFPDPFSETVVEELEIWIASGELSDITTALDAQISSVHVPEWFQTHRISRIYSILLELQTKVNDRSGQNKIASLLVYLKNKYQVVPE